MNDASNDNANNYYVSNNIGITISRSSGLSVNVLLIFDIHDFKGAFFLEVRFLICSLASLVSTSFIFPFTTTYITIVTQI